eukprot:6865097-Pyramimonas_sp.AAC.1
MLADADDAGWRSEKMSAIKPYMDAVLRSDREAYALFLKDLHDASLISWTPQPREICAPFFVAKKNGDLRLVMGCRVSNLHCRPPPHLDMGTGGAWSRLERPDGAGRLLTATAD